MKVPKDLQHINFNFLSEIKQQEYLTDRELYLLLYVLAKKELPHPDNYLFQLPYYSPLRCNWAFCVWSRSALLQPQRPLSTHKYSEETKMDNLLCRLHFGIYKDPHPPYSEKTIAWAKKQADLKNNYSEILAFANKYVEAYKNGSLQSRNRILSFTSSEKEVYTYLENEQNDCGNVFPITDTNLPTGTRFYEIILYLYLEGFIEIDTIDSEYFYIKIKILKPLPKKQYLGITLDTEDNLYYKGKKLPIAKPSKEFKLLKALVEGQGKIDKVQFAKDLGYKITSRNKKTTLTQLKEFRNKTSSLFKAVLNKISKQNRFKISQSGINITLTLRSK